MFNYNTLNIFTDASIKKMPDGETIGCAGANVISGPNPIVGIIEQDTRIIRGSTSNNSEIQAIKLGIQKALMYRNQYNVINLISDSKLCIYGLREWIFNWVRDSVNKNYLISSTNQAVANQEVILEIIYMILDNNLRINFYHQNGHVNIYNQTNLIEVKNTFISSNFLSNDVDLELIKNISIANDDIDKLTRFILKNSHFPKIYPKNMMSFFYAPFETEKYANLINTRR